MSINKVFISGNLTRDPELKTAKSGTSVLSFAMAVNDRQKNQQTGQWEDVPNFIDCTVFGNRAEPLSRFMAKGQKVFVEGRLRWHSWEAQDGSKRSKLEVIAEEVELPPKGAQAAPKPKPDMTDEYADEDMPF